MGKQMSQRHLRQTRHDGVMDRGAATWMWQQGSGMGDVAYVGPSGQPCDPIAVGEIAALRMLLLCGSWWSGTCVPLPYLCATPFP